MQILPNNYKVTILESLFRSRPSLERTDRGLDPPYLKVGPRSKEIQTSYFNMLAAKLFVSGIYVYRPGVKDMEPSTSTITLPSCKYKY